MTFEIHVPVLPCGRVPAYCTGTAPHPAHDFRPDGTLHAGWHCYGIRTTEDTMDNCQNNPRNTW